MPNVVLKSFLVVLSLLVVGPIRLGQWLNGKVRARLGERFNIYLMLASALALWLGIATGWYCKPGHGALFWLGMGVAAYWVIIAYGAPLLWLVAGRHLMRLAKWMRSAVDAFFRTLVLRVTPALFATLRRLPFSDRLWQPILVGTRGAWLVVACRSLVYVAIAGGSLALGYQTFIRVQALAGADPRLGGLVGGAALIAGLIVAVVTGIALVQFLRHAKYAGLMVLTAVPAGFVGVPVAGLPGMVLAAVIYVAYAFPLVTVVLDSALWRWLAQRLNPVWLFAYEGPQTPARRLLHQAFNIATAIGIGSASYLLGGAIGAPPWAEMPLAALALVVSYILLGKALDAEGGTAMIGFLVSAAVGIATGLWYAHRGWLFGAYGAVGAGGLVFVAAFGLVFPLGFALWEYSGRATALRAVVNPVSSALVATHGWVYENTLARLYGGCARIYRSCYEDTGDYPKLLLHVLTVAAALAAAGGVYLGTRGFALTFSIAPALAWGAVVLGGVVSYLVVGKIVLEGGIELIAAIATVAVAIVVGAVVYRAQRYGLYVAIPVAVAAGALTYALLFPIVYVVTRRPVNALVTPWALPVARRIFEAGWRPFEALWRRLHSVLDDAFRWFGGLWASLFGPRK